MDNVQQEINTHKTNLMNLINNLINTQLINQEIYINNEIKKECEFLNSLLSLKQKSLINQVNNNINNNPFSFQPNININPAQININPIQFGYQPIIQNNLKNNFENNNNDENNISLINVNFYHTFGNSTWIFCKVNEKISEVIEKYRQKTGDYNDNFFFFNSKDLNYYSSSTLQEQGISNWSKITVTKKGNLKAGNFNRI